MADNQILKFSIGSPYMDARIKRAKILDEIERERQAQDLQWGGAEHDDSNHPVDWMQYIRKFAQKGIPDNEGSFRYRMIQVAALAFAAIESYDRKKEFKHMERMKPCPFCGKNTLKQLSANADPSGTKVYFVACESCHTAGPEAGDLDFAVSIWNSRAVIKEDIIDIDLKTAKRAPITIENQSTERSVTYIEKWPDSNRKIFELELPPGSKIHLSDMEKLVEGPYKFNNHFNFEVPSLDPVPSMQAYSVAEGVNNALKTFTDKLANAPSGYATTGSDGTVCHVTQDIGDKS